MTMNLSPRRSARPGPGSPELPGLPGLPGLLVVPLAVLMVLLLAGCGSGDGDDGATGDDPGAGSPSSSAPATLTPEPDATTEPEPDRVPDPAREPELVGQVTVTRGGGETTPEAWPVTRPKDLRRFTGTLNADLADQVRAIVREHREPGRELVAQVVAIGCDEPVSVAAELSREGWRLVAQMPGKGVQCFAPMTTVAVFSVPAAE